MGYKRHNSEAEYGSEIGAIIFAFIMLLALGVYKLFTPRR